MIPTHKHVFYVAHPVTTDNRYTIEENLRNVIGWIRYMTLADPSRVYIAPWVAEVQAFLDENMDPAFYDRVLSDDEEVVRHLDGILLIGGKVSTGMARELAAARDAGKMVIDWSSYRTPEDMLDADCPMIIEMPGRAYSSAVRLGEVR